MNDSDIHPYFSERKDWVSFSYSALLSENTYSDSFFFANSNKKMLLWGLFIHIMESLRSEFVNDFQS